MLRGCPLLTSYQENEFSFTAAAPGAQTARRTEEVVGNESSEDVTLINPAENVKEDTIQTEKFYPTLFQCTHCDHDFITDEALLVHMNSIHPTFSSQAIKCTQCDYYFYIQ